MRVACLSLAAFLCLMTFASVHAKPDRQAKDVKGLITEKTQQAIDESLNWLAKEQADDGSWGTGQYEGNVAITSLAGLAFLSGNHQPDRGDHGKAVTKAVRFVLAQESKDIPGFLHNSKSAGHGPMYNHGFAVLFLANVNGKFPDKKLNAEVKAALERAAKLIVASQNDEGGWRYQPRKQDADLSATAVQIVALRAARDAGIEVPKETFDKAIKYVKKCQDPDGGGFRYQAFGGAPGFARTAAGLASLNRLGIKDGDEVKKGMDYLQKSTKEGEVAAFEVTMHYHYGHYYAAKAMWYAGEKDWTKWYPAIRDDLLRNRKDDRWQSGLMDSHYCTAMALIILQMPHGHLSSMKR